jgi:CRP-like cAMP-binding protein
VATAVIGLSLQDMLVNFVGGVVVELEQTVRVGDWIHTEQVAGAVTAVSLRHTVIQTADNDTVLLPNSALIRLPVTIVSHKHRRLIPFHLPYGCNPAQVVEAVETALTTSPINGTCAEPRPRCIIVEYHPSYVSFGVLAWLSEPSKEYLAVSTVLMRVHFALARHGQPLTSIAQTVELSQPAKAQDDSALANRFVEILRSTPIFHALPLEAVKRLAPTLRHAVFAPGEYIVRQGEESGSMYIVIHGSVDVHVADENGMTEYVATLEAGKFFGELSLFTGEKRTANVLAMTAVECLEVDKESLMSLFDWHPELAVDISEVITERQAGLATTLERLDGEQKRVLAARSRIDMLRRIQRYFRIGEADAAVRR